MPSRRSVDPRTPEGRLLDRAQRAKKLSDPDAAALVNTSASTWANWVKGYRSSGKGNPPADVDIDAVDLAVAADKLGISETALRGAGRQDAADELVAIHQGQPQLRDAVTPLRRLLAIREHLDALIEEFAPSPEKPRG